MKVRYEIEPVSDSDNTNPPDVSIMVCIDDNFREIIFNFSAPNRQIVFNLQDLKDIIEREG